MLPAISSCKLLRPILCCVSTIFALLMLLSSSGCGSSKATVFTQATVPAPPSTPVTVPAPPSTPVTVPAPPSTPTKGPTSPAYSEIYEFGDSITYGDGATSPNGATSLAMGYGNLMLADFEGQGSNFGHRGATSADESDIMMRNYNPQQTNNPAVTSMIGTNDLPAYGRDYYQFATDVAAVMEWATVPRNAKVFFTDEQCSATGTWAVTMAYRFPDGVEQSQTPASTFTCTIVTAGPALYFGFMQDTGWTTGSMTILIDGSSPAAEATINSKNYYGNEETYKFTTFRYPLPAGNHTFQVTVAGSGGSTGIVAPVWLGSASPVSADLPPALFIADVPVQAGDQNAALIAAYNTYLLSDIIELQADGLPIIHVQENAAASGSGGQSGQGWLNTSTDYSGGPEQEGVCPSSNNLPLHPGNCGHSHLRDAFEYYIHLGVQTGKTASEQQRPE